MLICNLCFWNSKIKMFLKNKDTLREGGLGLLKFSIQSK